jgi:two-component system, NarL family, sensor histidine kinase DevS
MDYLHWEVGEVYMRQEDGEVLQLLLHHGAAIPTMWKRSQYPFGKGMVGSTAKTGQAQFAELPGPVERELDAGAQIANLRHIAVYPLTGHRGVLGVLCLATHDARLLDELELQFLETISFWVGMVVENVRLNLQQRRLAVLEERERIGMDLHDGVIQSIYAVGLILDHARLLMEEDPNFARQRIEQAVNDLDKTIRDIRAYILDLRPRQLNDENLLDGVQRLVNEFRVNTLIDVSLHGSKEGLYELPPNKATALFHICQEALANIAKHARARHVNVTLWKTGGRALLEVSDNGKGFDFQKVKFSLGHGLTNMQTRARNVGGDIDISTDPGEGTTIMAWVPFQKEE